MRATDLPALGVGLGFRPPLRNEIFRYRPSIDFLEITIDHYVDVPGPKRAELELLCEHFPLIPHGLNLSLGSAEGIDTAYLDQVAAIVEQIDPPWWSEHIAFTRADGVEIGHLAPLPRNREALDALAANIGRVQTVIRRPLILENITSTIDLPGSTMPEAEFLENLCNETGCGLLLDLANLWINAQRLRRDAAEDLAAILDACADAVVQFHFVGPELDGREWVDSHGQAMTPPLWDLFRIAAERTRVRGAILERDQQFPAFIELLDEIEQARQIGRDAGRWT